MGAFSAINLVCCDHKRHLGSFQGNDDLVKVKLSSCATFSRALSTKASAVGLPYLARSFFSKEPASARRSLMGATSGLGLQHHLPHPRCISMLPGLILSLWTPAFKASKASRQSKWISAATGIGEAARIFGKLLLPRNPGQPPAQARSLRQPKP